MKILVIPKNILTVNLQNSILSNHAVEILDNKIADIIDLNGIDENRNQLQLFVLEVHG